MKGQIKWVAPIKESKNGGYFRLVTFAMLEGNKKQAHVDLQIEFKNYKIWSPLLKEGNVLGGLIWKDEQRGLIDGDSPVHLA